MKEKTSRDYSYLSRRRTPQAVLDLRAAEMANLNALNRYKAGEWVSPNDWKTTDALSHFSGVFFSDWKQGRAVGQFDLDGTLHGKRIKPSSS